MGASLNTAFNRKVAPYGLLGPDHPALGNGLERLDKLLTKAGLPTLGAFVSMDPEEWRNMDPDDPDAEALPPLRWFEPADGLIAVNAARTHLRTRPRALSWSADVLAELDQIESELTAAETRRARFHFEIGD